MIQDVGNLPLRPPAVFAKAAASYEKALSLTRQDTEQRFLKKRLAELVEMPRGRTTTG